MQFNSFRKLVSVIISTVFLLGMNVIPARASVPINGIYDCNTGLLNDELIANFFRITGGQVVNSSVIETRCVGHVIIPLGVTSIGISAFFDNYDLTSVTIPNSVTSIGDFAFERTSLTSVSIPDSVQTIGTAVFFEDFLLTSVRFLGNAPATVAVGAFANIAVGARANVGYNATGFDVVAGFWNGLIVVLDSAPAGDSGSDSSPTIKTITPVAVKVADSITNMKNKTYLSKYSMKLKLRENNLFKYSASDSFKYQVFKSSKNSCGMRGNYVMRYENSKTCDLYITRTNAKAISNKYWVKINYLK